jgi:hypothetical protein
MALQGGLAQAVMSPGHVSQQNVRRHCRLMCLEQPTLVFYALLDGVLC